MTKGVVVYDVECYINYVLIKFKNLQSGKIAGFEMFHDSQIEIGKILWILNNYTCVTFNGIKYDSVIVDALVAGYNNKTIKAISDDLIVENKQPWMVRRDYNIEELDYDHIDLMEVAPLKASLKLYGGRLHSEKLQDLPIEPSAVVTREEADLLDRYCDNDLAVTEMMFNHLKGEIELRAKMSEEYGVDLRSKSDAQIAEAVIRNELEIKYGKQPKRPKIAVGTQYNYKAPHNLHFKNPVLKDLFEQYTNRPFVVSKSGHAEFEFEIREEDRNKKGVLPDSKKKLKFQIGSTTYTAGVGGLHSCEKKSRHTNDNCILRDYDVASYYPRIILNNELYPKHIGREFLSIYNSIVNRRLKAKKEGDKITNESLKITINGSFGKFGNKWSCIYSPDLMMQVTITGQLSLIMLIEMLEDAGIQVVSANTDGIVTKIPYELESLAEEITSDWEFETGYDLEGTDYLSLNSRDVNNYIAVKESGCKGKGAYSDKSDHFYMLRSNPTSDICVEAVKEFLSNKIPLEKTIRGCGDIRKFLTLRTVNGGAIKDNVLLGKAIRWYYGAHELDAIYYKTSGNKVPKSDGGVPIMDLPKNLPGDLDYEYYVDNARSILKDIGYKITI